MDGEFISRADAIKLADDSYEQGQFDLLLAMRRASDGSPEKVRAIMTAYLDAAEKTLNSAKLDFMEITNAPV